MKQLKITSESAELEITSKIRNAIAKPQAAKITTTIFDADEKPVASISSSQSISADASVVQTIKIPNPHLWNGRGDPYLYKAIVEVTDGDGAKKDSVTVPIGLRFFQFDPKQGFILNGNAYDLHGVNRHQEFGPKSWAVTKSDMRIDMDLIKEMGCTAVRFCHYQHSADMYDLCDENGIVAWAELGLVNKIDPSQEFSEITKQQLTELIKQNFNHPSICMWSLYNELWFRNMDHDLNLVRELNSLAHELDSSRPTTGAADRPVGHPANLITDIVGFNRYYGWYGGAAERMARGNR